MVVKTSEMSTTLFKRSSMTMFDSTWCSFMYELKSTNWQMDCISLQQLGHTYLNYNLDYFFNVAIVHKSDVQVLYEHFLEALI